jgi:hypothetical protein
VLVPCARNDGGMTANILLIDDHQEEQSVQLTSARVARSVQHAPNTCDAWGHLFDETAEGNARCSRCHEPKIGRNKRRN